MEAQLSFIAILKKKKLQTFLSSGPGQLWSWKNAMSLQLWFVWLCECVCVCVCAFVSVGTNGGAAEQMALHRHMLPSYLSNRWTHWQCHCGSIQGAKPEAFSSEGTAPDICHDSLSATQTAGVAANTEHNTSKLHLCLFVEPHLTRGEKLHSEN